jgi:hypothetical protein
MITCKYCHQDTGIQYNNKIYCSNLYCLSIYSQFIQCFLEQLNHYFTEPILDKIRFFHSVGYWHHPTQILRMYKLPLKNEHTLYNNIIEGLNEQELENFYNGLTWLPAYRDENIIKTPFYPTIENNEQDLTCYTETAITASDFFNGIVGAITNPFKNDIHKLYNHPFYKLYFLSESIKHYIKQFLEWLNSFKLPNFIKK